jgi:hypothetical protein
MYCTRLEKFVPISKNTTVLLWLIKLNTLYTVIRSSCNSSFLFLTVNYILFFECSCHSARLLLLANNL